MSQPKIKISIILSVLVFISILKTGAQNVYEEFARINFSSDGQDENGWLNTHGEGNYWIDSLNNVALTIPSGLFPGDSGEPSNNQVPDNVGKSYHYLNAADNTPKDFILTGLNPKRRYSFEIFCSWQGNSASENRKTTFFAKDNGEPNEGEFLIIDDTYTYSDNGNGFKYWRISDIEDCPQDWTTPYNYEMGEIYQRYEVISQATNRPAKLQFGFWQDGRYANVNERETFSSYADVNGSGSVGTHHSSPSIWWELNGQKPLDFSRPNDISCFGVPLRSDEKKIVSRINGSEYDWDIRTEYHPMTLRATIVAVGEGYEFSGWEHWIGTEVSINPVGNKDGLVVLNDITPSSDGTVQITMSKLDDQFGYVNAMIVKETTTSEISIDVSGRGTVNLSSGIYTNDTTLSITATPNADWRFDGWTGDTVSNDPVIDVNVNGDMRVLANFSYDFPSNIIAKVNFTRDGYDEEDWINVHGSAGLPVDLGNGMILTHVGSPMVGASSGQQGTMLPSNVGSTSAVFDMSYSDPNEFKLSGLSATHTYNFYFFSSRNNGDIAGQVRETSFSIGNDTVTTNSVGNQFDLLYIKDVVPMNEGDVSIFMHRHDSYSYINALIVADLGGSSAVAEVAENNVRYYPVPAGERLMLRNVPTNSSVVVFNLLGRRVLSVYNGAERNMEIDMGKLTSGVYLFQVAKEGVIIENFKIVKK